MKAIAILGVLITCYSCASEVPDNVPDTVAEPSLPAEMWVNITEHLPNTGLASMRLSSQYFNYMILKFVLPRQDFVVDGNIVWKKKCLLDDMYLPSFEIQSICFQNTSLISGDLFAGLLAQLAKVSLPDVRILLNDCQIGDHRFSKIVQSFHLFESISYLSLQGNNITAQGFSSLIEALPYCTIKELDVSHNLIKKINNQKLAELSMVEKPITLRVGVQDKISGIGKRKQRQELGVLSRLDPSLENRLVENGVNLKLGLT